MNFLDSAVEIARQAGALIRHNSERRPSYELKGESDLVTPTDRASERLVVERLSTYHPSHSIVAEEGSGHDSRSEYVWYVDPLDGTTNFAHGFPMYCVSLGLERAGEMICGVVYDPLRDEMFTAERGAGAFLNNRRIRVSSVSRLEDSLVATGFPSRKRHINVNVHFYYQMAMATHGVRRAGSAALDFAYVACGRLDVFWEFGLKPWDMAAGMLLVAEAGGRVTDMRGGPAVVGGPNILTSNGHTHDETLKLFSEVFAGSYRTPLPDPQTA